MSLPNLVMDSPPIYPEQVAATQIEYGTVGIHTRIDKTSKTRTILTTLENTFGDDVDFNIFVYKFGLKQGSTEDVSPINLKATGRYIYIHIG